MSDNEILKLYFDAFEVDYIGIIYYEFEKSAREERKTWYYAQQVAIGEERKLDKNYKFTGKKVIIGRACSKPRARSHVEAVIYNHLMEEKYNTNTRWESKN